MAESPFKITQSDDGLSVRCEFDAHYVNDEDAHRICGYIDDLRDENARLRSCLSDDAENARMIMAENAKLRELVRVFYHCTTSGECDECPINGGSTVHLMPDTICGTIHDRMRGLGVEVE